MSQLLPGLRHVGAQCQALLASRSCAWIANALQPACVAGLSRAHSSVAGLEETCSPGARSAPSSAQHPPCQGQHTRRASGAAATTSGAAAGSWPAGAAAAVPGPAWERRQRRAVHASAAACGPAAEPARAAEGEAAGLAFLTPGRVQNKPAPPWTPTRELKKRNFLPRRMGYMMKTLEQEAYEKALLERKFPMFRPGDVVEVKLAVPENQRRTISVRGIVIAIRNRGIRTSFRLLNNITGGGNIERVFPLFCPTLQELRVVQKQRVKARRAKLYYLRDRKPSEFKV